MDPSVRRHGFILWHGGGLLCPADGSARGDHRFGPGVVFLNAGEQPVDEGIDRWRRPHIIAAGDIERIHCRHSELERHDHLPFGQQAGRCQGVTKRDAVPEQRTFDGKTRIRKMMLLHAGDAVHIRGRQPDVPFMAIVAMQNGVLRQVARRPDRPVVDQRWTGDGKQVEMRPKLQPAIGPAAVAVQDRNVDIRRMDRRRIIGCIERQPDIRIAGGKACKPRHQPQRQKR